jgi:hypothetical protein
MHEKLDDGARFRSGKIETHKLLLSAAGRSRRYVATLLHDLNVSEFYYIKHQYTTLMPCSSTSTNVNRNKAINILYNGRNMAQKKISS